MKHSYSPRTNCGVLVLSLTLLCAPTIAFADSPFRPIIDVVQRHTLVHSRAVTNLAWSPDSQLLATVGILSPDITIWNARSGKLVRKLQQENVLKDEKVSLSGAVQAAVKEDVRRMKEEIIDNQHAQS